MWLKRKSISSSTSTKHNVHRQGHVLFGYFTFCLPAEINTLAEKVPQSQSFWMNREISRSVSRDAGGFTSCGELARQASHANFLGLHTAGRPQREAPVIESTFWKVESESRVGGCSPVSPAPTPATFQSDWDVFEAALSMFSSPAGTGNDSG